MGIVHLIWPCGGKGWYWFWCSDAGGWMTDGWIGLALAGLLGLLCVCVEIERLS